MPQGSQPGQRLGRTTTKPLDLALINKHTGQEVGRTTILLTELYEGKGTEVQAARLKDQTGQTVAEINLTLKPIGFGLKVYPCPACALLWFA